MEITEVRIFPYKKAKKSNLKAFASVEFDECFAVTGLKVMDGKKGLFVSMPASEDSEGEYHDVCFPVTKKFRKELNDAVITAFNEEDEDEEDEKKSKKSKSKSKKDSKKSKKSKKDEEDEDEDDEDEDEDEEDILF